jgi:hypothetical protein
MSISSISSFMLWHKSSNSRPVRLKRRAAEADVAGTPRYCRTITLNTGKLISFATHHSSGSVRGHVLREMTNRGLCGLTCPSRTSERGGEGDCVKEGRGGKGERERACTGAATMPHPSTLRLMMMMPFICSYRNSSTSTPSCVFITVVPYFKVVREGERG